MHDVLIESVHLSLKKAPMRRLAPEAQNLIQLYWNYFIQLAKCTHLRIGGFDEEPVKLHRYALDYFVIAEVCRQLFLVIKDNLPQED